MTVRVSPLNVTTSDFTGLGLVVMSLNPAGSELVPLAPAFIAQLNTVPSVNVKVKEKDAPPVTVAVTGSGLRFIISASEVTVLHLPSAKQNVAEAWADGVGAKLVTGIVVVMGDAVTVAPGVTVTVPGVTVTVPEVCLLLTVRTTVTMMRMMTTTAAMPPIASPSDELFGETLLIFNTITNKSADCDLLQDPALVICLKQWECVRQKSVR